MIPQYIKTPYTAEQLRASGSRISSNNHANGTWRINGKNAMDKDGRIFLSFIKNSTYRELNYLRGLLAQGDTGFEKLERPFRMDKAKPFNPDKYENAFYSLAQAGEAWSLQRLITRTDLVDSHTEEVLMRDAYKVKKAIDAKATYGNRNQAAAESTDAMFDAAKGGMDTLAELGEKSKPTGEKCQTRHAKPTTPYKSQLQGQLPVESERLVRGDWPLADITPESGAQAQDVDGHNRAVGNVKPTYTPSFHPRTQLYEAGRQVAGGSN